VENHRTEKGGEERTSPSKKLAEVQKPRPIPGPKDCGPFDGSESELLSKIKSPKFIDKRGKYKVGGMRVSLVKRSPTKRG